METLAHKDGIPWYQAKAPRRWHRCRAHTSGWVRFDQVERCACGAIRLNGGHWMERNSR